MRIIGGKAKGRKLQVPRNGVRPTPDRVREALISMLAHEVQDARVLDLFAGTGAFGLECLSRGAASLTCVEKSQRHVQVLRQNIEIAKVGDPQLLVMPARRAITQLGRSQTQFDIIFLDPPFDAGLLETSLHAAVAEELLAPGGCAICEHRTQTPPPVAPSGWHQVLNRRYGDVTITVYRAAHEKEET